MDREKTVVTVQKLLALAASSPFEQEADAASRKAGELLAGSGLSMADIKASEESSTVGRLDLPGQRARIPGWEKILMSDVAKAFDCRALALRSPRGPKTLIFIGTTQDLELAEHFFLFFRDRVQSASARHIEENRRLFQESTRAEANAFRIGMSIVIGKRLRSMYEARNHAMPSGSRALVAAKGTEIDKYLKGWNLRRSKSRIEYDGSEYSSQCGADAGSRLNINQPVAGSWEAAMGIPGGKG